MNRRDNQPLPPVSEQRGMGNIPPKPKLRYGWRDIIIQALALMEDEIGIPYEESALYKRREKARVAQQITRR